VRAGAVERPELGSATDVAEGDNVEIAMVVESSVRPGRHADAKPDAKRLTLLATPRWLQHRDVTRPRDANCDVQMTSFRVG
jgi:hypothetical protein